SRAGIADAPLQHERTKAGGRFIGPGGGAGSLRPPRERPESGLVLAVGEYGVGCLGRVECLARHHDVRVDLLAVQRLAHGIDSGLSEQRVVLVHEAELASSERLKCGLGPVDGRDLYVLARDRKSTRLNSSQVKIS